VNNIPIPFQEHHFGVHSVCPSWEKFCMTHIYFSRYFGPEREEGTEGRIKLHNEEDHYLNSLQNIIWVIR
jgi:hypothetical protein